MTQDDADLYRCTLCGEVFVGDDIAEIPYTEYPGASTQTYDASPCCHSDYEYVEDE